MMIVDQTGLIILACIAALTITGLTALIINSEDGVLLIQKDILMIKAREKPMSLVEKSNKCLTTTENNIGYVECLECNKFDSLEECNSDAL